MIRSITLLSLLFSATTVFANGLYKWVEADGSITFSPNPPPAGVEFERIGAANDQPTSISSAAEPSPVAVPAKKPVPAKLTYAPGDESKKPGITRSEPQVAAASAGTATDPANKSDSDQTTITVAASKQRRCEDLKKRVISLERRLKVRLSPADMDNTVVHMARYQQSYNQHCLR